MDVGQEEETTGGALAPSSAYFINGKASDLYPCSENGMSAFYNSTFVICKRNFCVLPQQKKLNTPLLIRIRTCLLIKLIINRREHELSILVFSNALLKIKYILAFILVINYFDMFQKYSKLRCSKERPICYVLSTLRSIINSFSR